MRRLTHEQRVLVHQVHPAKLAVDISASVVSNVLPWKHAEWLAIDPKGLLGDRCFDVCQFFRNPGRVPSGVNRRRLDIFCAELDLDRQTHERVVLRARHARCLLGIRGRQPVA